jgi:hypothetical protein
VPKEDWWSVKDGGVIIDGNKVIVDIVVDSTKESVYPDIDWYSPTEVDKTSGGVYTLKTSTEYGGMFLKTEWDRNYREYTL